MSAVRICHERRCTTRLSRYNVGPRCWFHTPMTFRAHGNGRKAEIDKLVLVDGPNMSNRFLEGVPDTLSPEDRELIRSGEWIGVG